MRPRRIMKKAFLVKLKIEEDEVIGSSATNGMKPKAKVKGKKANLIWALLK